jgi:hypothetical protein
MGKTLMPWYLWRQDDNGNRFLVGVFSTSEDACGRMDELTRSVHKQTYWVSERDVGVIGESDGPTSS